MLFWILILISAVLIVWGWIAIMDSSYMAPETWIGAIVFTIFYLAVSGAVGFFSSLGISYGLANIWNDGPKVVNETERSLVALQTRESTEGKFYGGIFASYGYVNGVRVLSYISEASDGGLRTGYAEAANSVVYQGDEDPKILTYEWEKSNGWLFPWGIGAGTTYTLYVPEGSVTEGYEVAP